ncbi:MAG: hypothetical protein DHS80DRAFT_25321 [Piptocephalis tieghemiana]|nr:MAG: hypothetical protein DHS80DRAFT_25321 [Piptocephalis tieghemiana]
MTQDGVASCTTLTRSSPSVHSPDSTKSLPVSPLPSSPSVNLLLLPPEVLWPILLQLAPQDLICLSHTCSSLLHPSKGFIPDSIWERVARSYFYSQKLPYPFYPDWRSFVVTDLLRYRTPPTKYHLSSWHCHICLRTVPHHGPLIPQDQGHYVPVGWASAPANHLMTIPYFPFTLADGSQRRLLPRSLLPSLGRSSTYLTCPSCFHHPSSFPDPQSPKAPHGCQWCGASSASVVPLLHQGFPPDHTLWGSLSISTIRQAWIISPSAHLSLSSSPMCQVCHQILQIKGHSKRVRVRRSGDVYLLADPPVHLLY